MSLGSKNQLKITDISSFFIVKDICNAVTKSDKPSGRGELTFQCPIHADKWTEVNVVKGTWRCYRDCPGCPGNNNGVCGGSMLDFVKLFYNCSDRKEAWKIVLKAYEGNRVTHDKRETEEPKAAVSQVETASPKALNEAYEYFLGLCKLTEAHKKDLRERGLSDEDIERVGFKSIPQVGVKSIPKAIISAGIDLHGVPGFFFDSKGQAQMCIYTSGYFIPYRNEDRQIVCLQIRRDRKITPQMTEDEIKDVKRHRYCWFTSSGEDNGASASNVPFFGIPGKRVKDGKVAYITEGGLKASVAESISGGWFTAIPGISCYEAMKKLLEFLRKKGVTTIVDAFDSDRFEKPHVAESIGKLHKIAKEYGFEMKTWDWGTEQKGVDDYLLFKKKEREGE